MTVNISNNISLHRYFLSASRNKSLFYEIISEGNIDHPHAMIHMLLWYACLYVVVEGWKEKRLSDPAVDAFLRDTDRLDMLKRGRNAVFHYDDQYTPARLDMIFREDGFVPWITGLHDSISDYFLK